MRAFGRPGQMPSASWPARSPIASRRAGSATSRPGRPCPYCVTNTTRRYRSSRQGVVDDVVQRLRGTVRAHRPGPRSPAGCSSSASGICGRSWPSMWPWRMLSEEGGRYRCPIGKYESMLAAVTTAHTAKSFLKSVFDVLVGDLRDGVVDFVQHVASLVLVARFVHEVSSRGGCSVAGLGCPATLPSRFKIWTRRARASHRRLRTTSWDLPSSSAISSLVSPRAILSMTSRWAGVNWLRTSASQPCPSRVLSPGSSAFPAHRGGAALSTAGEY